MPDLAQMAIAAVRAIRPDVAEEAEKRLSKYSKDEAGLRQLVKDSGGREFLNKAADFASRAPRVKAMFQRFGADPHAIKEEVIKNLYETSPNQQRQPQQINAPSNYKDRLSKLK